MANVTVPASQKQNPLGKILPAAGAVVGGVFGGGAGGAVTGASAGQMAAGVLAPDQSQQIQAAGGGSAMQRRADLLQPPPPSEYAQLAQAESALQKLPPEMQQQYGPALQQARMRSQGAV